MRKKILISALQDGRLGRDLIAYQPTHIVSLINPSLAGELRPTFPRGPALFELAFFDVEDPRSDGPMASAIKDLIAFLSDWAATDGETRLLTHCHMGASRSTAAAFIALAIQRGPGLEQAAFDDFLGVANKPWPNLRMVAHADEILNREGALIKPLSAYREAYPRRIEAYRRLNGRRGIFW